MDGKVSPEKSDDIYQFSETNMANRQKEEQVLNNLSDLANKELQINYKNASIENLSIKDLATSSKPSSLAFSAKAG